LKQIKEIKITTEEKFRQLLSMKNNDLDVAEEEIEEAVRLLCRLQISYTLFFGNISKIIPGGTPLAVFPGEVFLEQAGFAEMVKRKNQLLCPRFDNAAALSFRLGKYDVASGRNFPLWWSASFPDIMLWILNLSSDTSPDYDPPRSLEHYDQQKISWFKDRGLLLGITLDATDEYLLNSKKQIKIEFLKNFIDKYKKDHRLLETQTIKGKLSGLINGLP